MRFLRSTILAIMLLPACRGADEKKVTDTPVKERDFTVARTNDPYRLVLTDQEIACEHPKRKREVLRWDEIVRVWFVTTSEGPQYCDNWLLFEGKSGFCSVPTEAEGFETIWSELKTRFADLDYRPIVNGGVDDAKHLCWQKAP